MSDELPPTTLPADSAAKVLGADLRNTVAQVAAGQRLPEADRARLETSVLADADPAAVARLAKERQANLLKIWASGRRRLTPAELKELEPVLPREILARPPTKKAGYQYPLAHYVEIYGAAERTLKHWIQIGRAAQPEPDLPPLDEPAEMKSWYARNKKNRVPDRLVQIAADAARVASGFGNVTKAPAAPALPAASAPAPAGDSANPPAPPAGSPAAAPATAARGYMATLERLRIAEAAAGERYTRLVLEEKDAEAADAERRWQKLRNDLRAYEKDAQEVMASQGKLWPADEVVAVLHEIHTVLLQSFESLYDRIETQLETLPRAERKRFYREEARRLRSALVANKFTAPPAPQQLAA